MENRMFLEMGKAAARWLHEKNPEEIAGKAGVEVYRSIPGAGDGKTEEYRIVLKSLGKSVTVSYPSGEVVPERDGWHRLLLLHYLVKADGTPVLEERIPFGGMKDGLIRGTGFDRASEKELSRLLRGKEPAQIRSLLQKAGAEQTAGKADFCTVFRLFPRFPVYLDIWFADEEFPASGKLFVSSSADHYLTIEDAVTAGELILRKLNRHTGV